MYYDLQKPGETHDVQQDIFDDTCCFNQKYYSLQFCKLNMVRLSDEQGDFVLQFRPSLPANKVFFGNQRMYLSDGNTFIEMFKLSDLIDRRTACGILIRIDESIEFIEEFKFDQVYTVVQFSDCCRFYDR